MKDFLKKIVISILYLESKLILFFKKPKIIAITGTVGKTTTKDLLYAGLKDYFHTRKSPKGFNSDIGVLLTILDLDTYEASVLNWTKNILKGFTRVFVIGYPELLILEVGANYPGEIQKNAKLLKPDVAMFTKLPEIMAHMEFFRDRQHFVNEKLSLARQIKNGGVIIYNGDDPTLTKEFRSTYFDSVQKVTFGKNANYQFKETLPNYIDNKLQGTNIILDKNKMVYLKGVLGEHLGYGVSALVAVSSVFELDVEEVIESLEKNFVPAAGRMRIFDGINNSVIIDDSYNALPESIKNGSDLIKNITVSGRKIYVLGRLAELGDYTDKSYKEAVKFIRKSCDIIFLVNDGKIAQKYAKDLNFKEIYSFNERGEDYFANTDDLGKFLKIYIEEGDILIFKGARHSTGFERAISRLIKEEDIKYLVQDHLK